jgi:glycosyltransferase involved in cell wall biosynthesis
MRRREGRTDGVDTARSGMTGDREAPGGATAGRRAGRLVMAVLPPSARGPLPKIAPLLVRALEEAGWTVDETPWGGRSGDETRLRKVGGRLVDLVLALGKLAARPGAVLFVNSAHSWRGLLRDVPLLAGARLLGHGSVVLLHGSAPEVIASAPRSPIAAASRLLARCADAVLVLSNEELGGWRAAAPAGRYFTVVNPYRSTMRPGPRPADRPPALLFVGRVMAKKGVLDLVEAYQRVRATDPCTLEIVGDGPDAARVAALLAQGGPAGGARLCGYAEGVGLARHYEHADIFVLPTYWSEGFPTVLAEAMDAGLAIVTTRYRGMADHLKDGVNCLFVSPRDPEGLAAALTRLVRDPDLRRAMGEANRAAVAAFAPDAVVGGYLTALGEVESARRARAEARRARLGRS